MGEAANNAEGSKKITNFFGGHFGITFRSYKHIPRGAAISLLGTYPIHSTSIFSHLPCAGTDIRGGENNVPALMGLPFLWRRRQPIK